MPELPDIELYVTRLNERIRGQVLERTVVFNPFVLRSVHPPLKSVEGRTVDQVSRLGKRIVLELQGELFIVIHLMISGRLGWHSPPPEPRPALGRIHLAVWRFPEGQLTLGEPSTKKRASIHVVEGRSALQAMRRAGLDLLSCSAEATCEVLRTQNRTLKRALTDPAAFDGIGNAFSDEILFHARLSPLRLTSALTDEEASRLHAAAKETLADWKERLEELIPEFPKPKEITAFRPEFCVHGRYGKPCRVCVLPIQRIVYAENETHYCAQCQNEGRMLADRSLSRLLREDWPKTLEEMLHAEAER